MNSENNNLKDISTKYWNIAESILGFNEDIDSYNILNSELDKQITKSTSSILKDENSIHDKRLINCYNDASHSKCSYLPYEDFIKIHELILCESFEDALLRTNKAIAEHGKIRELMDLKAILESKSKACRPVRHARIYEEANQTKTMSNCTTGEEDNNDLPDSFGVPDFKIQTSKSKDIHSEDVDEDDDDDDDDDEDDEEDDDDDEDEDEDEDEEEDEENEDDGDEKEDGEDDDEGDDGETSSTLHSVSSNGDEEVPVTNTNQIEDESIKSDINNHSSVVVSNKRHSIKSELNSKITDKSNLDTSTNNTVASSKEERTKSLTSERKNNNKSETKDSGEDEDEDDEDDEEEDEDDEDEDDEDDDEDEDDDKDEDDDEDEDDDGNEDTAETSDEDEESNDDDDDDDDDGDDDDVSNDVTELSLAMQNTTTTAI